MASQTSARVRLTHSQKTQFEVAQERYCESQDRTLSQDAIILRIIKKFCADQGVRFSIAARLPRSAQNALTMGSDNPHDRRPA